MEGSSTEDLERKKFGQSDERTIYEVQERTQPLHEDFCSITIDEGLDSDILQQRIHSVVSERENLQHLEVDLRAQLVARSALIEMRNSFNAQIKAYSDDAEKLKDQIQEREHIIHELELHIQEKDREIHAIKIDTEAAWAKESLLMEQNQELGSFRRQHDTSEAERAHCLKQIHDLKEYVRDKETQILKLEEQLKGAQDSITYKDNQLRDIHAWVARAQEMDGLQSSANHSLQAELRERTDQFNQILIGYQRQFVDVERHHLQVIQHLQLELAEARGRSGTVPDETHLSRATSEDATLLGQDKGDQLNVKEGTAVSSCSEIVPNGDVDTASSQFPSGNASTKTEHAPGVSIVPTSLFGIGPYLSPGHVTAVHPFVMHQQGIPHSIASPHSHVPQAHMEHGQPIPAIMSHQHWPNHQAVSEGSHILQHQPPQTGETVLRQDAHYDYKFSGNGQVLSLDHPNSSISSGQDPGTITPNEESQVLGSNDNIYSSRNTQQQVQENKSKTHDELPSNPPEQSSELKEQNGQMGVVTHHLQEGPNSAANTVLAEAVKHQANSCETMDKNPRGVLLPESSISSKQESVASVKHLEPTLLDERSLLVCIVRAIPAGSGGRIRISSTLSNRLGKMLVPFHWHDYKKKYGKLDDFVTGHSELFVVEGDFIQLREGAQEMISATAAVEKVAAAAAASAPYLSAWPSVAVTPIAQNHRLKKVQSFDSAPVNKVDNGSTPDRTRMTAPQVNEAGNGRGRNSTSFVGKHHGRISETAPISRR